MPISKSEQSFVKAAILSNPPQRADGRRIEEFRPIALQIGGDVAPLANGSGRVNLGGSEVIAAIKLEAEDVAGGREHFSSDEVLGRDGGRVVCTVSCSQSAYPSKTSGQLDDMSADLSTMLGTALSACLTPSPQLTIVPRKKSWLLNIDALVLADCGNIFDAILVAIRGALWDLRIPRTRGIEYEAREDRDSSGHQDGMKALLKQRRKVVTGVEFDLEDSWDEGEHLRNRDALPIGMTLNLIPPYSFLDASIPEEESVQERLHMIYSFPPGKSSTTAPGILNGFQLSGPGEVPFTRLQPLLADGEKHARSLSVAINTMLSSEEARANTRTNR